MQLIKKINYENFKDKAKKFNKLEKRVFKILARSVDYDDYYLNELCPNCTQGLKDNSEYLFETGWKEKWIFLKCKNCNQVVRA